MHNDPPFLGQYIGGRPPCAVRTARCRFVLTPHCTTNGGKNQVLSRQNRSAGCRGSTHALPPYAGDAYVGLCPTPPHTRGRCPDMRGLPHLCGSCRPRPPAWAYASFAVLPTFVLPTSSEVRELAMLGLCPKPYEGRCPSTLPKGLRPSGLPAIGFVRN